ncbi:MAG: MOSC domain-containing protein [Burkholderiales bacterium]|nr:MAG: MOSC domain-containing protein [Burkholderiales bacterium]
MTDLVARIAGLWRYPVKSCAGEAVDRLTLGADGWPEGDRAWGIVDAAGELTWMGAHPRLALVQAQWQASTLRLQGLGRAVAVPLDGGADITVRGWNGERQAFDELQAWDGPDEAAALLQEATGAPLRLVRLSLAAQRRPVLNALHLVGDGSLQAWQDALPRPLQAAAPRVRPNVVLTAADGGPLTPFIEDLITAATLGRLTLRRTGPCVRCVMTSIDPQSGVLQPPALDALTQLSAERLPGEPVQFGIYVAGSGAGELRVGDEVELTLAF